MISLKVFNCIMIRKVRVTAGALGVYGVRVTSLRYPVDRKHQDSRGRGRSEGVSEEGGRTIKRTHAPLLVYYIKIISNVIN